MNWFKRSKTTSQTPDLAESILYDETTFYNRFSQDLLKAQKEVIIESPYITTRRLNLLKPTIERLISKGVEIFIVTRYPEEHDDKIMAEQAEAGIRYFEGLGAQVLLCAGGHHRKLAIIDREVLWEGSLNILSFAHSREFMRRIDSKKLAEEMFKFLKFDTVKFFRKKLDLL